MTKLTNVGIVQLIKKEGDFTISRTGMKLTFVIFCAKYGTCSVEIHREPPVHPVWQWNGDYENPTLTPSIGCDQRCGKHVNITNGELLP